MHTLKKFSVAVVALVAILVAPVNLLTQPGADLSVSNSVGAHVFEAMVETSHATALSDYGENHILDWLFRAQTFTPPTSSWIALATTTGSDAACGTEVTGGAYARVQVTNSLANWAGTQSSGSTVASTGTSGTTSNNAAITFPAPTATWGLISEFCDFDASTGGNLIFRSALTTSKNVNSGDAAPSFAISALTFQIDN